MKLLPTICPACKHQSLNYEDDRVVCRNCRIYQKPLSLIQKVVIWTVDKKWWLRLPVLGWFVLLLVQNLKDPEFALNRLGNPLSGLDFGIHELGHILFSPFGEFLAIAGGSLFQCIFPIMGFVGSLQKRWFFAACMCFCWLGLNFFDVATYAADARARLLPLSVGIAGLYEQGSDEAYDRAHDWYQLLSRTNHLEWDQAIASTLRVAGTTSFIIGFTTGAYLLINMAVRKKPELPEEPSNRTGTEQLLSKL